jgi:hypothetical protein
VVRAAPRLVTGVLTAASATGQLIFLPVVAEVTTRPGWRWASIIVAAALVVVPLVLVLCRNYFGARSPVVFGWVFAAHQVGAAVAAAGAGRLRDMQGNYDMAFYIAGLCGILALLCLNGCDEKVTAWWTRCASNSPSSSVSR